MSDRLDFTRFPEVRSALSKRVILTPVPKDNLLQQIPTEMVKLDPDVQIQRVVIRPDTGEVEIIRTAEVEEVPVEAYTPHVQLTPEFEEMIAVDRGTPQHRAKIKRIPTLKSTWVSFLISLVSFLIASGCFIVSTFWGYWWLSALSLLLMIGLAWEIIRSIQRNDRAKIRHRGRHAS